MTAPIFKKKRVIIIGAGPCGLVALKEMREAGHDAHILERSSTLGGVFAGAAAYPNLHLTISNWAMAFSDFPDPRRLCYSSAEEYLAYLQSYARHFGLENHITYSSDVQNASLRQDNRWLLQVRQHPPPEAKPGQAKEEHLTADALIVATGANQVPRELPDGLSGFQGRVLHSSEYSEALKREVKDGKLRVLVVGGGESGADVAAELGDLSPHVTVWLRRAVCVGPRYLNQVSEMAQVAKNKTSDFPANGFLEAATTNRMSAGQNVLVYGAFRRLLWSTGVVLNPTLSRMGLQSTRQAPLANDQATYVTKNQRMCEALQQQKIEVLVSSSITTWGTTCRFGTGDGKRDEERQFDAIVLCHGYRTAFPWLKVPVSTNPRHWFLHCFPPGLAHCLFFVGYARPHQGGIPAAAEMLSRYIALILGEARALPAGYGLLARDDEAAARDYYFLSPDLHALVDYNAFMESVARRVGCEPRLPTACVAVFTLHVATALWLAVHFLLLLRPLGPGVAPLAVSVWWATLGFMLLYQDGLLIKWWFYPHWSVWYRQRGPSNNPALLSGVLGRVRLWQATAITRGFVLLILWSVPAMYMQCVLSVPVFLLARSGRSLRPKMFALHSCEWRWTDLFAP